MRIVDPVELSLEPRLESVMTAVMPPHLIDNLSNAMREVDQFDTPGPARMAVLKLDAGPLVVVVYHELKNVIEILAPLDHAIEKALAEVVDVLRIPRTAIEWLREGLTLSSVYEEEADTVTSTSPIDFFSPVVRQTRFWGIEVSASIAQRPLSASESISLTLLAVKLRLIAGDVEPIDDTGLRVIQMADTILFEDGSEAAPLAVYYRLADDGSTAVVVDIEPLPSKKVHVAKTLLSAIETALVTELGLTSR